MNAKEFNKIHDRINNLGPYWRDVSITRPRFSKWKLQSSVWMDNGYGGGLVTINVESDSLINGIQEFITKIDEHDKLNSHRYM